MEGKSLLSGVRGLPWWLSGKESRNAGDARDVASIPGLGRFPGEGKGYPLQYSGLENSMGCIVHESCIVQKESDTTELLSLSSKKAGYGKSKYQHFKNQ